MAALRDWPCIPGQRVANWRGQGPLPQVNWPSPRGPYSDLGSAGRYPIPRILPNPDRSSRLSPTDQASFEGSGAWALRDGQVSADGEWTTSVDNAYHRRSIGQVRLDPTRKRRCRSGLTGPASAQLESADSEVLDHLEHPCGDQRSRHVVDKPSKRPQIQPPARCRTDAYSRASSGSTGTSMLSCHHPSAVSAAAFSRKSRSALPTSLASSPSASLSSATVWGASTAARIS